jgi:hypothetical protein
VKILVARGDCAGAKAEVGKLGTIEAAKGKAKAQAEEIVKTCVPGKAAKPVKPRAGKGRKSEKLNHREHREHRGMEKTFGAKIRRPLSFPVSVTSVSSVVNIRLFFVVVYRGGRFVPLRRSGVPAPVPVKQPMAISHKRHMEADMKCLTCHPGAEDQALAQFPTVADCMDCHGKARGNHPDEPKVRAFAERGQEIPWVRVDRLPGHVYFSHAART